MKQLTLLCLEAEKESALLALRKLGVVHLLPVHPPAGEDLDEARKQAAHCKEVLSTLGAPSLAPPPERNTASIAAEVTMLRREKKGLEDQEEAIRQEIYRIEPFGHFDPPDIAMLQDSGVYISLYALPRRRTLKLPEDASLEVLSETKHEQYVAVISSSHLDLGIPRVPLPEQSLHFLNQRLKEISQFRKVLEQRLDNLRVHYHGLQNLLHEKQDHVRFLEARKGMGRSASIAYLKGFFPADAEETIRAQAARCAWGLIIDKPDSSSDVPTLIRNPGWVKPIQPVFDFIGILPGYREVDISTLFLLFFSVFFAMIVGDAGYGAIFLGLTLLLRKKMIQAQPQVFILLLVMSLGTIIWGVLTGNYLGMPVESAPFPSLRVAWLGHEDHMMALCFLIGAVHLTLAHAWNIIRYLGSGKALEHVGWICTTWVMYFLARNMILGSPLPTFLSSLFTIGLALIFIFMSPLSEIKKTWSNYIVLPLNIVGNFVDLVSYIRLFAVGMATYSVAAAFNEMALGIGFGKIGHGLLAAFILFFGHVLNMALAGMGVLVHGIRLNALEFSTHLGLEWSGIRFTPFRKQATALGEEE